MSQTPTEEMLGIIMYRFGDTYTILVSGQETGGRYTKIDMHIAADAGPPPHRHDFDESFTMLRG